MNKELLALAEATVRRAKARPRLFLYRTARHLVRAADRFEDIQESARMMDWTEFYFTITSNDLLCSLTTIRRIELKAHSVLSPPNGFTLINAVRIVASDAAPEIQLAYGEGNTVQFNKLGMWVPSTPPGTTLLDFYPRC